MPGKFVVACWMLGDLVPADLLDDEAFAVIVQTGRIHARLRGTDTGIIGTAARIRGLRASETRGEQ